MGRHWLLPRADSLLWTIVGLLVVWQVWVSLAHVEALVAPTPAAVVGDIIKNPGIYISSTVVTLWIAVVGLVLGMLLGALLALLAYFSPLLSGLVTPLAMVVRTVPVVAIIPVIARMLGYGQNTLVGVAIVISFFPSFVLLSSGLRDLPAGSSDLFAVLGAGRLTRLVRLALPSAVPLGSRVHSGRGAEPVPDRHRRTGLRAGQRACVPPAGPRVGYCSHHHGAGRGVVFERLAARTLGA
jgi:ABC-type nitrate/sulfonate/bicarbonate transport system permease component